MKNSKLKKILAAAMLIVTVLFSIVSCAEKTTDGKDTENTAASETITKVHISVDVIDDKGEKTTFDIATDADNLGDALVNEGLVKGENGQYGLFITTVNGLVADYDTDKAYWAITREGEYLMTGADSTPISDGDKFELTYTKE
ncbi:MAG: DUF4430 domain-containing protein [Clostridiales bacterium]|nr:DUF4430 domain-containing protein [Clostridiales bacterium]